MGIEIQAAGKLTKEGNTYKSYFGTTIPSAEVRTVATNNANQKAGHYQKYTDAQETALVNLLLWLFKNNPDVFSLDFVVGHDEVSPGRKNDPGGALSSTMPKFRQKLKSLA